MNVVDRLEEPRKAWKSLEKVFNNYAFSLDAGA